MWFVKTDCILIGVYCKVIISFAINVSLTGFIGILIINFRMYDAVEKKKKEANSVLRDQKGLTCINNCPLENNKTRTRQGR